MHQRPALATRKKCGIQLFFYVWIRFSEDDAAARTAQGFMSCRCGYVGNLHRARVDAGSNQTCHVSHINEKVSAYFVGYLPETLPIDYSGVRRKSGRYQFRAMLYSESFDLGIVDLASIRM